MGASFKDLQGDWWTFIPRGWTCHNDDAPIKLEDGELAERPIIGEFDQWEGTARLYGLLTGSSFDPHDADSIVRFLTEVW